MIEGIDNLTLLFEDWHPESVACEDYRVYSWKSQDHSWAELHTAKLIGCIVTICHMREINLKMRMATAAKGFVTDDKLKTWGLYVKGQRHSRDAIRHAVYQSVFGDK